MAAPPSEWSGVLPFSMQEVQDRFFRAKKSDKRRQLVCADTVQRTRSTYEGDVS